MSEEEKQAIEFLNKVIYQIGEEDIMKNNCILLNLIDKLQKENEELKEEIKDLIEENHKHIDYIADMKKKHEDKIRTKIKELEKTKNYIISMYAIGVLEELLGDE